ncbi:MAG: hypothetical protein R2856_04645 [Caldilineaceae bacterium]
MNRKLLLLVSFLLLAMLAACSPGTAHESPQRTAALPMSTPRAAPTPVTAPTAIPLVGTVTLTKSDDGACTVSVVRADSGVEVGPCAGIPQNFAFSEDTPNAPNLINSFVKTFSSFESETPVGVVQLVGSGAHEPTRAQQRQIAETAFWLAETAVAGRTSAAAYLVLTWHREGGIAGFCDDLAIYTTGQAVATSCSGVASDIALSDAQLGQLYAWLDTLQSFEVKQNDPAGAADAMQITLLLCLRVASWINFWICSGHW